MMYETVHELFGASKFNASALIEGFQQGVPGNRGRTLHYKETSNGGNFTQFEQSLSTLITFDKLLESNARNGVLVGKALTYADLALFLKIEDHMGKWESKGVFDDLLVPVCMRLVVGGNYSWGLIFKAPSCILFQF
jgi:hypothetical protein